MRPSQYLPTAAFGVAISWFFVPPVLAMVGAVDSPVRKQPRLEVSAVPMAAPAALPRRASVVRQSAAQTQTAPAAQCSPAEGSVLQNQPWRAWVVADLGPSR
jgi:hypothetical protein